MYWKFRTQMMIVVTVAAALLFLPFPWNIAVFAVAMMHGYYMGNKV